MDTLEQLRRRLETFDDLRGLVRTMKALAAVSIHHHEQAVHALTAYRHTIELGLQVVLRDLPQATRAAAPRPDAALGIVVFGSDHGLCGRFNEDVADHAHAALAAPRAAGAPLRVLAVGARAAMHLSQMGLAPEATQVVPSSPAHLTAAVRRLLNALDGWHADGVERVWLLHQRPVSSARHEPVLQRLLPLEPELLAELAGRPWASRRLPMTTMERPALLSALLRQHLFVAVSRACAESLASENGARLLAMQAAEKNLTERGELLGAEWRRRRQEAITAELLDLVGGYEALREDGEEIPL
jgi:F-type H+-transporting ATPase subunit gamma